MAEFSDAKSGAYCTCTREKCSDECRTYRRFRPKPITNADRIRSMTDEELVNFIVHHDCCPGFVADTFSDANRKKYGFDGRSERCEYGDECHECWLDWLRQKA